MPNGVHPKDTIMRQRLTALGILFFLLLSNLSIPPLRAQQQPKPQETTPTKDQSSPGEELYFIQIRVILAGTTGIVGTVPAELSDMKERLLQSFRYPAYTLWNTVRLSFFGNEETAAMLFPDHYIRLIPKGRAQNGGGIKIKAEVYYLPPENNTTTKFYLPGSTIPQPGQTITHPPIVGLESSPQQHQLPQPLLPIVSSALILKSNTWESVGGIPVRVNAQDQVRSSHLSSSPIPSAGQNTALGQTKFLILGLQHE